MLYPVAKHNHSRLIWISKESLACHYVFGFAVRSLWIMLEYSVPKACQFHPLNAVFETYSKTFSGYVKGDLSFLWKYFSQKNLKKDIQILSANCRRCWNIYSRIGIRQPRSHGLVNENHGGVPCPRMRIPMRLQASIIDATRSQLQ